MITETIIPAKTWKWESGQPAELIRAGKGAVLSITGPVGKARKDGSWRIKTSLYVLSSMFCPVHGFLGWELFKSDDKKPELYHLDLKAAIACSCGDAVFRGEKTGSICKHVLAIEELLIQAGIGLDTGR